MNHIHISRVYHGALQNRADPSDYDEFHAMLGEGAEYLQEVSIGH